MGPIGRNPANEQYRQGLFAQLAALPPDVRNFIASEAQGLQITVLPLPYWSTVRFQSTIAANAATIDTTQRKAFAYGLGGNLQIAGFTTAGFRNANLSDTNLQLASQTRDNADVYIWGMAASVTPDSEPSLAARVWRETSVEMSLNGSQTLQLGTLEMFPGAGGLHGVGNSYLKVGPTNQIGATAGGVVQFPFFQNGNPMAGNFLRFPQPFKWSGIGTAGADSALVVTCTPQATITETVAVARAAVAVVAMVTPGTIEAYAQPAAGAIGTYVDVRFHLICVSVSKRSVNT